MRKKGIMGSLGIALLTVLIPGNVKSEERPVLRLDLEKALEIALSENPTIRIANLDIQRTDYAKKEAIGNLLPQIEASAQYTRTLKKQVMYMDMPAGGSSSGSGSEEGGSSTGGLGGFDMSKGIEVGRDNNWNGGFSAQLPVIAPAAWKNIQLTSIDIQKSLEAARGSRYTLVNQVEKAYYGILNAQDSYRVIQQSYDNAKLNAKIYRDKYEQGTASEYDMLRAEVQVRNLEPSLLQAENGVALAKLQLSVLLGLDLEVRIETADKLADYEQEMYAATLNVDTSLQYNSNLRTLDLERAYAKKAIQAQKAAYYPTLALTGSYTWLAMNNDFKFKDYRWNPYSTIGLSLSIPLFQGGTRYYRVKQARIGAQQLEFQRQDLTRQLKMQVKSSLDNIDKSVRQIASNKEGVRQAEKAYQIMQKSFEIGSANFVELNDADLALTSSRLSYYQAIYDYLAAKSELDLVLSNTDLSRYMKGDAE